MGFSWAKMALVATLAGGFANAMAQQSNDVRLDLTLKDADMMVATNTLFMRAGVSFVIEPSSTPYNKITLKLQDVTPEEAVRYICQAAGAYFRRDESGVYVISHTPPAPVNPPAVAAAKRPKLARKVHLHAAGAEDVYNAIVARIPFDSTRVFDKISKFKNIAVGGVSSGSMNNFVNTVQTPLTTFGPSNGNATGLGGLQSNTGLSSFSDTSDLAAQRGGGGGATGFGGGGGQNGGFGGGGGQNGGFGGQNGQGGGGRLESGTGLVPDGIDSITFDPTDNSFVVYGEEDAINQLQGYIQLFDVVPKQVTIKVEFITTTETIERTFGTEFLYQRGTVLAGTRPGSFVRNTDPVFLNYATGNVTARLRTALTESGGKVVAAPILRTLNNQPAFMQQAIVTYFFTTTQTISNGTVVSSTNPNQLIASTSLFIQPRINDDNTITVSLAPQLSTNVGNSTSPDGQQIPNQVTQSVAVTARVANNETIVLGGLTQKNDNTSVNKVPVLADLPVIGQFFRFRTGTRSGSELLIFVTPSIVDENTTGNPGGP